MPFFGGSGGGAAGIGGSTGATDNAVLRADGTGAATLQNSALNIDDPISPFSITGVASTDIITATGHNFTTNQGVIFPTLTGGAGLTAATTVYFVRDISGDTFKVSTTSGGSAVNFTTDISAGTVIAIQANVTITNNHSETNSSLVLTPKGTGAFIVGPKPDGTSTGGNARGASAIDIQTIRNSAGQVASGANAISIGQYSTASSDQSISIGYACGNNGLDSVNIGNGSSANGSRSVGLGKAANCNGANAVSVGHGAGCGVERGVAIGYAASATVTFGVAIGGGNNSSVTANIRSLFATIPFRAIHYGGSTTNNTATTLNIMGDDGGGASDRLVIAANTAIMADLFIIARRTDTVDKWFSSRRTVAIRRNNANGTAIIGSVQTIGTDQTEGSPSWSVAVTADDTEEALQVQVTGAASETVQWRVLAIYRAV